MNHVGGFPISNGGGFGVAKSVDNVGNGVINCASCSNFAGDYLRPPKTTVPCCWCGKSVPVCSKSCGNARVSKGGGGGGGGTGSGGFFDVSLSTGFVCNICGGLMCSMLGCSVRCERDGCEVSLAAVRASL